MDTYPVTTALIASTDEGFIAGLLSTIATHGAPWILTAIAIWGLWSWRSQRRADRNYELSKEAFFLLRGLNDSYAMLAGYLLAKSAWPGERLQKQYDDYLTKIREYMAFWRIAWAQLGWTSNGQEVSTCNSFEDKLSDFRMLIRVELVNLVDNGLNDDALQKVDRERIQKALSGLDEGVIDVQKIFEPYLRFETDFFGRPLRKPR